MLILSVLAYSVFRTPATASRPIEAIPLASSQPTLSSAGAAVTAATAATANAPASATEPALPAGAIVAQIVQEESEARFVIDEVLNGKPNTVVGTTNQVAGEIAVDPNDPTKSRVGIIQVNARTFVTDSGMRNRTIQNRILFTGQYEFITFTPTQLVGLPERGAVGQSYTFQIVGDLTIRDVTKAVTFDVTATPTSETRLEGMAQATINYADFGINIPRVPQVASVADQVRLEIDFVATAK